MSNKRQMKSAARLYAVQALFQMEQSGQDADSVITGGGNKTTLVDRHRTGVTACPAAAADGYRPAAATAITSTAAHALSEYASRPVA